MAIHHHPRKRRTREHVIASQSINYVERFIIDAGHTAQRIEADYGYDLVVCTYDHRGYAEGGVFLLQLKASDYLKPPISTEHYTVRISVRDFDRWRSEPMPVFLILFDARRKLGYWLYFQKHVESSAHPWVRHGQQTISLRVPVSNRMSGRTVAQMRRWKARVLAQMEGVLHHHDYTTIH